MKWVVLAALILNGLLLPCGCFALAAVFDLLSDLGFKATISVTNATTAPIKVTPIGVWNPQGERGALPMMTSTANFTRPLKRADFSIPPNQTIELCYNWDDVNLSEIVVEDAKSNLYQIIADPQPTLNLFRPPNPSQFTVTSLQLLQTPLPTNVLAAYREAKSWKMRINGRVMIVFIPWVTFPLLLLIWLRLKKKAATLNQFKNITAQEVL